ncbi:hypothetical protein [Spirosoma sp. KCTC 42546]|nr:hypothetical protein [Spirosoma sp. KCTC 42546]
MQTYSLRKLFTGFINAALTLWKLTVSSTILTATKPATANIYQAMSIL